MSHEVRARSCYLDIVAQQHNVGRLLRWLEEPVFRKRHITFTIVGILNNCRELQNHEVVYPAVTTFLRAVYAYKYLMAPSVEALQVLKLAAKTFRQFLENHEYIRQQLVPELRDCAA